MTCRLFLFSMAGSCRVDVGLPARTAGLNRRTRFLFPTDPDTVVQLMSRVSLTRSWPATGGGIDLNLGDISTLLRCPPVAEIAAEASTRALELGTQGTRVVRHDYLPA